MRKILVVMCSIFMLLSSKCIAEKVSHKDQIIYSVFPSVENYIDSFIRINIKGHPCIVIEPRIFKEKNQFLTYKIYIRSFPNKQDLPNMIALVSKTNRMMKVKNMMVPVLIKDIDQVFTQEGSSGKYPSVITFPQPEIKEGYDIVIDFNLKRWKFEDHQDW